MSELGKMINDAIDKAQEFAGDVKAATDEVIDKMQEQAPVVLDSFGAKTEDLAAKARENFPTLVDEAKDNAAAAMDAAKAATDKAMDASSALANKAMDVTKEVADKAAETAKAAVERMSKKDDAE